MCPEYSFDAVEIDARSAYLDLPVLSADSLEEPVAPLAHEVASTEDSPSALVCFNALVRKTSVNPTAQRNVSAGDDELAHFAARGGATLFIDQRETVARQRIPDRNAGILTLAGFGDEPLHHRRFRRRVDDLDCGLG